MKSSCAIHRGLLALMTLSVFSVAARGQNQPPQDRPLVGISSALRNRTAEPCPLCRIAPGIFTVARTGATNAALTVSLAYDGTAKPGADYLELPRQVTLPAGAQTVDILLLGLDDQLVEGPEIVRATLLRPEPSQQPYLVSSDAVQAMIVIGDDESGAPEIRLDIVIPNEGAPFAVGTSIPISALGVWTQGELDQPVEFFAGDRLIGRSNPPQLDRPTIPGLPSAHTIVWNDAPTGQHVLSAHFPGSAKEPAVSPPVTIVVGSNTARPGVRIEATQPIAEESSAPYRRLPLRGIFTVSRTGPASSALSVFVHYSGSATSGTDYPAQPFLLTIPAGEVSAQIEIVPINDGIWEGIESVVATLSQCPPETRPPLGIACRDGFAIDPASGEATVFMRDDGATQASVSITQPKDGAVFALGETILIEAVAIDLEGYISRLEFYDGTILIGVSEIVFIRAPDPGTPIYHSFEWTNAAPGTHSLTAHGIASDGNVVASIPVNITVDAVADRVVLEIVRPENGAEFSPNAAVEIEVEARDPDD